MKPEPLPPTEIDRINHISLIGAANAALVRFDGLLLSIKNLDLLLTLYITQEAVISSRIDERPVLPGYYHYFIPGQKQVFPDE